MRSSSKFLALMSGLVVGSFFVLAMGSMLGGCAPIGLPGGDTLGYQRTVAQYRALVGKSEGVVKAWLKEHPEYQSGSFTRFEGMEEVFIADGKLVGVKRVSKGIEYGFSAETEKGYIRSGDEAVQLDLWPSNPSQSYLWPTYEGKADALLAAAMNGAYQVAVRGENGGLSMFGFGRLWIEDPITQQLNYLSLLEGPR